LALHAIKHMWPTFGADWKKTEAASLTPRRARSYSDKRETSEQALTARKS